MPKLAVLLLLAAAGPAFCQGEKARLKWGMDSTGGAPYVYDNQTKGFEVDLAAYLAKELGREPEWKDADWDKLPQELAKGDIDIVLNGYEYKDDRRKQSSVPYYVYSLTLVANAKNPSIRSWADLTKGETKKSVGVLEGSAAQTYMDATYGDAITLVVYKDVATTFDLVTQGRLDATVQDNPAATYYVANGTDLRPVEETRATGAYVVLTREEDAGLRRAIDDALRKGIDDGTLEAIYRKYGIWNDDQERLAHWRNKSWGDREATRQQEKATAPPMDWRGAMRRLLLAAGMTVLLAVCAMPLATLLGMAAAVGRLYGPPLVRVPLAAYVEVIRGTPLLLQLFLLYYVLPAAVPPLAVFAKAAFGEQAPIAFGILALAVNYSASLAEHFRGAFLNLPRGQYEAALSLGLTRGKAIRHILVPQAFRAAVPSVTNDFVALFKDTAVCSVIAVMELTKQYNTLFNNHRDYMIELAAITAGLYLAMSYPLSLVSRRLEHKAAGR